VDHSTIALLSNQTVEVAVEDSAAEQQQSRSFGLHEVEDASKSDAIVTVAEIAAGTMAVGVIAVVGAVDEKAGHSEDESRVAG
jgi:hypothetical protein